MSCSDHAPVDCELEEQPWRSSHACIHYTEAAQQIALLPLLREVLKKDEEVQVKALLAARNSMDANTQLIHCNKPPSETNNHTHAVCSATVPGISIIIPGMRLLLWRCGALLSLRQTRVFHSMHRS